MRKHTYYHILRIGTVLSRNLANRIWYRRLFSKSEACLTELLHLIPPLLFSEEVGEGDVYFLEVGAKSFTQSYPEKNATPFIEIVDLCLDLKEYLEKSYTVQWDLPADIENAVRQHRQSLGSQTKG